MDRLIRRRVGAIGVLLRPSNESPSDITCGEFRDSLRNCQLFNPLAPELFFFFFNFSTLRI